MTSDLGIEENIFHLVMQCPHFEHDRVKMFQKLKDLGNTEVDRIVDNIHDLYFILMVKHPEGDELSVMIDLWDIAAKHISRMYTRAITGKRIKHSGYPEIWNYFLDDTVLLLFLHSPKDFLRA